jgi:DNA-binding transcriptional LysR family regulator
MIERHPGANGGEFDWDDLRYVLAVAHHGSAGGAARALDVAHATVLRRIQSIERDFGMRIFDRLPSGLVLTEAGRPLLAAAESIDKTILETRRLLAGRSAELAGPLRITTTDSLMDSLMPSLLQEFRTLYPAVVVEVLVTNSKLDLDAMDADVALRAAEHPPESWVGRRLARMNFAVYATPSYLSRHEDTAWQEMDWLLPESPLSDAPVGRWITRTVDSRRAVFKANSFVTLRRMCEAGLGATALPCFLGTPSASLRRLDLFPDEASTDLWVLTHEDLRRAPRVRAFLDHAAAHLQGHRLLFEGADH